VLWCWGVGYQFFASSEGQNKVSCCEGTWYPPRMKRKWLYSVAQWNVAIMLAIMLAIYHVQVLCILFVTTEPPGVPFDFALRLLIRLSQTGRNSISPNNGQLWGLGNAKVHTWPLEAHNRAGFREVQ